MSDERFENFDRVSDVLAPFTGYGKIMPEILERAAARGTKVHQAIHMILSDLGDWGVEDGDAIQGYLASFSKFWDEQNPFIEAQEQRFFNEEWGITGQVDMIAKIGSERVLIDWKTSTQENPVWALQAAAYKHIVESAGMPPLTQVWFVKLHKLGKEPEIFQYEGALGTDLIAFTQCLYVYRRFFKGRPCPKIDD